MYVRGLDDICPCGQAVEDEGEVVEVDPSKGEARAAKASLRPITENSGFREEESPQIAAERRA